MRGSGGWVQDGGGAIASKLQALGISPGGAWQLVRGQIVASPQDRQRLAVVLRGLLTTQRIQPATPGNGPNVRTQSGMVVEFLD